MLGLLYLIAVVALASAWAMSLRVRKAEARELRRTSEELATKFRSLLLWADGLDKDKTTKEEPRRSSNDDHPQEHTVRKLDPAFEEAVAFYESHLEELVSKYDSQYIAIRDGQVQDCDADFAKLAERVYAKFGYQDIFMPKVARDLPRVRFPSPRIVAKLGR